jgi:hypothetical protein
MDLNACIISPYGKTTAGYAVVRTGRRKTQYHHRLVLATKLGVAIEALRGFDTRHTCDNPSCVNPAHLVLGTRQDNVQDMHDRGRARKAIGEAAGKAKLTEVEVLAIRSRTAETCTSLALEFGVSHKAILAIWHRKTWTHI